jgi:hypothetical protein
MRHPQITRSEWEEFKQEVTLNLIANTQFYKTVGRYFLCRFPDVGEALYETSNLGTPAGVYNPSNDSILEKMVGVVEAYSFIEDLVEIIEETDNV